MMLTELLRTTALRYEAAVNTVMLTFRPECGCQRPGTRPQCESCPCLPVFESLIRQEIQQPQDPHLAKKCG